MADERDWKHFAKMAKENLNTEELKNNNMNEEQRIRMKQKFADAGEQSALTNLEQLPSRIRHYLLEWKDCHLEEYCRKYDKLKLRDLTKRELRALFYYATSKDFLSKSWED